LGVEERVSGGGVMKLAGLFSGVGGFELAAQQLGHEVAWMCEIDESARRVLKHRFPDVKIYADVRDIDPAEVEAVDILTGGSPCQGFSIAGNRTGLEHEESQLFGEYIRVVNGLAKRGLKWAVWENVPGVLSIKNDDGERTFENVVAALVGANSPVRLGAGSWNTGLADGGDRAVAWRVLDSRYFGVAQRRRRVFACVAFGDSPADRAWRALLAKPASAKGYSESRREKEKDFAEKVSGSPGVPAVAGTLAASGAGTSRTSGNGNFLDFVIRDFPVTEDIAFVDSLTPWPEIGEAMRVYGVEGRSPSLKQHSPHVLTEADVRRLTPVECERLQGFPDDWTQPAGSESARYKAMGNAVTVNTVRYVLKRVTMAESS